MTVTSIEANMDEARDFAGRIGGLREIEPGTWESVADARVSYPEGGHATFAAVEESSYWFNHRNTLIASLLTRYPPAGMIVDVGGGNGYVSVGLRRAGFASVVVEPGLQGARCARDRGLPVIKAPFETLDIPFGAMPAIGLFDVLEHIEDATVALHHLHQGIRPGGRLYLTVPAFDWLWSVEDVRAGHFRRYTLESLRREVTAAGFTVEYATYFFAMLVPPVFALRALPSRLRLTRPAAATNTADDHRLPGGPVGAALSKALAWEARRIANGGTVPFGSSCLMVARRPSH